MVTKRQNGKKKNTEYLLFYLFIQFSAIEIRLSLFSRRAYDKFITIAVKKSGVHMLVVEP